MLIAINTTTLTQNQLDANNYFPLELLTNITQQYKQHQFIFIFNKAYSGQLIFNKNVTPIIIKSSFKNSLTTTYWYNVKLPLVLKKHKPDLLIQTNGICCSNTKISQLLFFLDASQNILVKNLNRAKKIVTSTNFNKQHLIEKFNLDANKINVIQSAVENIFKPVNTDIRQQTKDGYADGREYFLFFGGVNPNNNVMQVLKAFSMFKKWQYSNMKLLIEGSLIYKNEDFVNKIKTYKYRDDVLLLGSLSKTQIATITASAYCVLYTPKASGFVSPIIAAMQSGVPIITMNNIGMQETGGNIPLYSNSNQPEDIAEQMQLIYKDENLRTNLMQKGVEQASKFSWEKTIENFWNVIEEAIK